MGGGGGGGGFGAVHTRTALISEYLPGIYCLREMTYRIRPN